MLLFESATKHDDRIRLSAMKSRHDCFGDISAVRAAVLGLVPAVQLGSLGGAAGRSESFESTNGAR